jgi:signal transduction histidine kinase
MRRGHRPQLQKFMKRPWQVWLLFAACVLGAFSGMAWLTRQALEADARRRSAEAEAGLEQRVSLALWRMDTELAPIIAAEVIRPPGEYRPMRSAASDPPPYVLLQFETTPKGVWLSPQVAGKRSKDSARLAELSKAVNLRELIAELPSAPLPTVADANRGLIAANAPPANANLEGQNQNQYFEGNRSNLPQQQEIAVQQPAPTQQAANQSANFDRQADFQLRGKRYQDAAQQSLANSMRGISGENGLNQNPFGEGESQKPLSVAPEQVGVSRPVWVGDRLLLARRVGRGGQTIVQGSWLDWPRLKLRLLDEATELLPKADLAPVNGDGAADPSRMLAGLPVRLVVGETLATGAVSPTLSWALQIGWGAVLLAVAAAAFLLQGVMTLSERRAAFVSSVTHELRTPLTTFRMYAEMLAKGMVPDANRRQEYFNTLQREAERLTLLVENVLAYARLERGRRPQAHDQVTLAALLDRVGPRLKQRAAQADMRCELQLDGNAAHQEFTTDQAVVEQILFNLVDNAAKYAREAEDRTIHVEANRNGHYVRLVVRDHGPGIKDGLWSRRMQPFGKSAQESAESAPGVGLGLALCRRLARQLGGRLEITDASGGGAALTLLLPTK